MAASLQNHPALSEDAVKDRRKKPSDDADIGSGSQG
jgi:hypothetical protein